MSEAIEIHDWQEFKELAQASIAKKYAGLKTAKEQEKLLYDCIYAKSLEVTNDTLRYKH